jgi:hypothetical protein
MRARVVSRKVWIEPAVVSENQTSLLSVFPKENHSTFPCPQERFFKQLVRPSSRNGCLQEARRLSSAAFRSDQGDTRLLRSAVMHDSVSAQAIPAAEDDPRRLAVDTKRPHHRGSAPGTCLHHRRTPSERSRSPSAPDRGGCGQYSRLAWPGQETCRTVTSCVHAPVPGDGGKTMNGARHLASPRSPIRKDRL